MNKEIIIAGKKIFYRVYGSGKKVMLVHGFGETGDIWNNQVAHLKTKFQLIVPDLPGSGTSEMIDDMSMEGMADVLKAILKEFSQAPPKQGIGNTLIDRDDNINSKTNKTHEITEVSEASIFERGLEGALQGHHDRIILIGHSMGGYVSLAFAEKYPQYLDKLGLFHSTAYADSEEKKAARLKGIDFINDRGAFEFLKTTSPNLFSSFSKEANPALIDNFIQGLNNFFPKSLVSYYKAMINRPDRTNVLVNSKLPMLFIMGESDNAIPLQDVLKQCYLPEKSYIHILKKSGHMGMLEEADPSNKMLEKFIEESWLL